MRIVLDTEDGDLRRTVVRALAALGPARLDKNKSITSTLKPDELAALKGFTPMHLAAQAGVVAAIKSLAAAHPSLVDQPAQNHGFVGTGFNPSGTGNTPLHLAAESGHLECCQVLVARGARVRARNLKGKTPEDLAKAGNHALVVEYLAPLSQIATTRAGKGDAFGAAMRDDRFVTAITWHQIPIQAIEFVGGFHSLLEVIVGEGESAEHYVLEKAQQIESPNIVNGVFVSRWESARASVEKSPLASADGARVVKGKHTMKSLHEIATSLGPYNVATANCHHAAREVFNACAVESARMKTLPNATLAAGAKFLQFVGFDIVGGGSTGSGGASGSAKASTTASESVEGSASAESASAFVVQLLEQDATETRGLAEAMGRIQREVKKDEFTKEKMALIDKM